MLFSQLPTNERLEEKQQIDLVYCLLHLSIRDKEPCNTVNTYDELFNGASAVEQLLQEKQPIEPATPRRARLSNFCKNYGYTYDQCRKRKNSEAKAPPRPEVVKREAAPVLSKVSCYSCGAPGVYRSNWSMCSNKPSTSSGTNLTSCAIGIRIDAQARPAVLISRWTDWITQRSLTLARRPVLRHFYCTKPSNYVALRPTSKWFYVTLADRIQRRHQVRTFDAAVNLVGRTFQNNFIVLPESRDNRTLLGIGFLKKAGFVLNFAQFTWTFIQEPIQTHELYTEDFVHFDKHENLQPSPLKIINLALSTSTRPHASALSN